MQVEDKNIWCAALDDLKRTGAIRGQEDGEALALEPVRVQIAEIVVVFNDQHALRGRRVGRGSHNEPS